MQRLKRLHELMKVLGCDEPEDGIPLAIVVKLATGDLSLKQYVKTIADIGAFEAMRSVIHGHGHSMRLDDFMRWLADRIVNKYGEPEGIDFVNSLREWANEVHRASELLGLIEE